MKGTITGRGKCLCGSVKVTASAMYKAVGACHCNMCRKWGGGPYMAVNCGSDISFEGEEHVKGYDSSSWAERGFCSSCGSHLYFKLKGNGQFFLAVGIIENQEEFVFERQVFIDEKPNYYCFSNETSKLTGKELLDMYASKSLAGEKVDA